MIKNKLFVLIIKMTTRRDFLKTAGLSFVSLLAGTDILLNLYDKSTKFRHKNNLEKIYNETYPYTYLFSIDIGCYDSSGLVEDSSEKPDKREIFRLGTGIVLSNKFLTLGHLFLPVNECKGEIDYINITSYGSELEKNIFDSENEIVLFNLPKDSGLRNFPYKPNDDIYLGKEVYIIGNKAVSGFEIKKTDICNLNKGSDEIILTKNCFGIREKIEKGCSGAPVVDSNRNLLGLCTSYFHGVTYVKKIEEFLKYI